MEKNILELRNISKQYDGKVILKGISVNIKEGEFVTLLGPSGCGKTTTLRLIGGFEKPDSGEMLFEGKNWLKVAANKREVNTVFQNYALFPHMNVFDNIAYGLKIKKKKFDFIKREVCRFLRLVGLDGFADARIESLSGGQKQRVALARALINRPRILLLDEPMSALDVKLRKKMQSELKALQEEIGITFILVTHDQEEALTLSDRIIVMNKGAIQQVGTPSKIYNEPENLWTAQFIGDSNIISDAIFVKDYLVKIDGKNFSCLDRGFGENEDRIDIIIRPEDIDIVAKGDGYFNGTVESLNFKGVHWEIVVATKHRKYLIHTTDHVEEESEVAVKWNPEDIHVMWKEIDD
ncbi:spermidine/putrescine ABC transporter ATP-binding protein [Spiroplasma mirum ATCC 29335]|uniref:Spermidine/putrescine import ATP-binding protein PotA n=1 Tax=Spiroplasma mirum ATCC 29335 TaxID=838561 RepID=W0GNH4_9MOLU|nr:MULTISPECIES: spermidine/putrescine ABC transporter ATP-binding protein [Spiroplasma]AHF60593.1 ABC-type spermidine/putrescine transport system ATP-binding protein [Spiroplasma mirum ATCC 29335]AHI57527.1 spermidine/putrescine ABC transporter ATP-binding protein [Spiroplasma mirum ATCC 29335]AKM52711.1 spermidine/putrescine ABC transporter ATP-binding protein [Spiroplasma atrichopogonis]